MNEKIKEIEFALLQRSDGSVSLHTLDSMQYHLKEQNLYLHDSNFNEVFDEFKKFYSRLKIQKMIGVCNDNK